MYSSLTLVSFSHDCTALDYNYAGKAVLTYFGKWDFVEPSSHFMLSQQFYTAPGESVMCG